MKNNSQGETFVFTYSAKEQEEIKKIRQKYVTEENKMEQLRRLDKNTTKKGTIYSIAMGIVGCLLLGIGMCCILLWNTLFVPGIIIGIIGIGVMAAAYPVYSYVTGREREKIAPEILRLTEELLK